MPANSVNVSGTLRMPSGLPAAFATVRFTLSNAALLGVTVVVPVSVIATADSEGRFSTLLVPNSKFAYYTVFVYRSTGAILLETVAVIPDIDCKFSEVIQARKATNISASIAALDAMQIAQANIETARLQVIAVSAIANSDSQAAILRLQNAVSSYEVFTADAKNTLIETVVAISSTIDLVTAYQLSK